MSKFCKILFFLIFFTTNVFSNVEIDKIEIKGNSRISDESIIMFGDINLNKNIDNEKINTILNNIYNTNFFKNVSVEIENNVLIINVEENPIIQDINFNGIKSETIKNLLFENIILKPRTSFTNYLLENDIAVIENLLKSRGYYFSKIEILTTELDNNQINLDFNIELGKKAKIKKISFIGDKIFKDTKLKSVIISEEYKFWKFISGKKYLNESILNIDNRLLKNFYLNKGFYNVEIKSSFARITNVDEFELIYNIDANEKVYFNNLELQIPNDFNQNNFININNLFKEITGKHYSINIIEDIIEKIENLAIYEEYESIGVSLEENLIDNKLDLTFVIKNIEKQYIQKINIFGNNITNENVIRNNLLVDEGDPFNQILFQKSINEIKRLNFFRNVNYEILDDLDNTKIININLEEKPTGEISLGAGFGTGGANIAFAVKENNFLGKGVSVDSSLSIGEDTILGQYQVTNPNYKNSDKSFYYNIQALEVDKLSTYGYKSNKAGFSLGSNFEYYDDFFIGIGFENFIEKIETSSTASASQRSQAGNYLDTFLNLDFNYDKRNQRFETTSGYFSIYNTKLPLISESLTLVNEYSYKYFTELYENNITTANISISAATSLNNKNVKLSERLFVPSRKLRGFESGKIGPKDGNDYIGGNLVTTLNLISSLPKILENSQNLDFSVFYDLASISGVDYNSSLDKNNDLKSSIGIGVDWITPIGPLSFSFAQPITKSSTDVTETFRFNLGTSF